MIVINTPCERCVHFKGLINSWHCGCDAFPDGFPKGFPDVDVRTLEECTNGYRWEPKDNEKND